MGCCTSKEERNCDMQIPIISEQAAQPKEPSQPIYPRPSRPHINSYHSSTPSMDIEAYEKQVAQASLVAEHIDIEMEYEMD